MRAAERSRVGLVEPARVPPPAVRHAGGVPARDPSVFGPVMARLERAEQQREKLAALGRMSAGLAHELNNPVAAAKRTAAGSADALDVLDGVMREFVESGVERTEAAGSSSSSATRSSARRRPPPRSGLDAADAEDEIGEWLEAHAVPDAWQLAEPLAAAGLDAEWLEAVAAQAGAALPTAVRWIATTVTARSLSDDLRDSTQRMSELVQAIKAYTYMDQAALQEIDVHEGIEATLDDPQPQAQAHARSRSSASTPPTCRAVCVYGSELNQVWTNLLDNAIDALGETGTIRIATAPWHETGVEVRISDDGPGIPEEAAPRVRAVLHHQGGRLRHRPGARHDAAGSCASATTATCGWTPGRARRRSPCACRGAHRARASGPLGGDRGERRHRALVVLGPQPDVRLLAHRARGDADRLDRRRGVEHRHDEQRLDGDRPRPARVLARLGLADRLDDREDAPPDRGVVDEPVAGLDPRPAREAGAAQQLGPRRRASPRPAARARARSP